jgi:hypothetical protein
MNGVCVRSPEVVDSGKPLFRYPFQDFLFVCINREAGHYDVVAGCCDLGLVVSRDDPFIVGFGGL